LIELLVVITIIGILVSLLFPAVQAAREMANQTTCTSQLSQLAKACKVYESTNGYYPSGGWGWSWPGMPGMGAGRNQPGGWCYAILPHLDEMPLYELGKDLDAATKRRCSATRLATPLEMFICPSRRKCVLLPTPYGFYETDPVKEVARTDYAMNCGDQNRNEIFNGPGSITQGLDETYWDNRKTDDHTGISFQRSEITSAEIRDGESNTYLLGEKYLNTDHYFTGTDPSDNETMYVGYDNDNFRSTWRDVNNPANSWTPLQDQPGFTSSQRFGGAHVNGSGFVFVDGSVHYISWGVDSEIHRCLGNRADLKPIPAGSY